MNSTTKLSISNIQSALHNKIDKLENLQTKFEEKMKQEIKNAKIKFSTKELQAINSIMQQHQEAKKQKNQTSNLIAKDIEFKKQILNSNESQTKVLTDQTNTFAINVESDRILFTKNKLNKQNQAFFNYLDTHFTVFDMFDAGAHILLSLFCFVFWYI